MFQSGEPLLHGACRRLCTLADVGGRVSRDRSQQHKCILVAARLQHGDRR